MSYINHPPQFAQPGDLYVTEAVFTADAFADDIQPYGIMKTSPDRPTAFHRSFEQLTVDHPKLSSLVQEVKVLTEDASNIPVTKIETTLLVRPPGLWFPPHIDQYRSRRVTFCLAGCLAVFKYQTGNFPAGDITIDPGEPVSELVFPPGAVMSVNNECELSDRHPHATKTPPETDGNSVGLIVNMYGPISTLE